MVLWRPNTNSARSLSSVFAYCITSKGFVNEENFYEFHTLFGIRKLFPLKCLLNALIYVCEQDNNYLCSYCSCAILPSSHIFWLKPYGQLSH